MCAEIMNGRQSMENTHIDLYFLLMTLIDIRLLKHSNFEFYLLSINIGTSSTRYLNDEQIMHWNNYILYE